MKYIHCLFICITLFFSVILPKETTFFEEVRNRDTQAVRERFKQDGDYSQKEEETENNALHIAAENDDPEMIELLTTQPDRSGFWNWLYYCWYNYPKIPNKDEENKEGKTPLHSAIERGHGKATQKLLQQGVNPNKKNKSGETPLHYAVDYQHVEIVQQLLEKNANPNEKNNEGHTPLQYGIARKNTKIIKSLAQHGADLNAKYYEGQMPLHYFIAHQGELPFIQCLIDSGADLNKKDDNGYTPLHIAIDKDQVDIADYLLGKSANSEIASVSYPSLFFAIQRDKPQFIPLFVKHRLHLQKRSGSTLLHYAIEQDKIACIKELIQISDLINQEDSNGNTPAMLAAKKKDPAILKILQAKGIDLTARASNGWQPIHSAVSVGNYETTKYLLDNGVPVDSLTGTNNTPLLLSVIEDKENVMELLLSRKADVRKCNKYGKNILLLAVEHKRYNLIQRFKKYPGIDINMRDENGMTAFMHATINKDHMTMAELYKYGADAKIADNAGETPLHKVARSGDTNGLAMLVPYYEQNSLNKVNLEGNSAIFIAAQNGDIDSIRMLLHANVSLGGVNKKGETIFHQVAQSKNTNVLAVITGNHFSQVNINMQAHNGLPAIHYAVSYDNVEMMQEFTKYGATYADITRDGDTLAHTAAYKGSLNALKHLKQHAPLMLQHRNKGNKTPFIIAAEKGHGQAVELLCAEKDFLNDDIEIAIGLARINNHGQIVRSLEQKKEIRMNECIKVAHQPQEIIDVEKRINALYLQIIPKDSQYFVPYGLHQPSSPKRYSAKELYKKTEAERAQISLEYNKMLDVALRKERELEDVLDTLKREEEEEKERMRKENERIQEEKRRLEEQARQQRIAEENRKREAEQERIRAIEAQKQRELELKQQAGIKAQQDEFDRLRKEKEREDDRKKAQAVLDAQKAELDRLAQAKALADRERARQQQHTAALEQQQPYVLVPSKRSANG